MTFNKALIIGNLTRDPELTLLPGGSAVCKLALALNRKYKVGEEQKEEVSYLDIVVFGKQAETSSQYLSKGSSVLIDGRLKQERWDDKETGKGRSKVVVIAERVQFMGKKPAAGEGQAPKDPEPSQVHEPISQALPMKVSSDVPF